MVWGLHLISMSISNIISALKILSGTTAEEVQFHWPTDVDAFGQPWKRSLSIGVTSMTGLEMSIPEEFIEAFNKETILSKYQEGQDGGIRRIVLQE